MNIEITVLTPGHRLLGVIRLFKTRSGTGLHAWESFTTQRSFPQVEVVPLPRISRVVEDYKNWTNRPKVGDLVGDYPLRHLSLYF